MYKGVPHRKRYLSFKLYINKNSPAPICCLYMNLTIPKRCLNNNLTAPGHYMNKNAIQKKSRSNSK